MFGGTKKAEAIRADRIDTIIGEKAVVEGIIKTTDTTRIDGTLNGRVESQGILIIGETGLIKGDIFAKAVLIAGTVHGNLQVKEKIEVAETGNIIGDIITKTLYIAEGAIFKGNCAMETKKTIVQNVSEQEESREVSVYEENGETIPEEKPDAESVLQEDNH